MGHEAKYSSIKVALEALEHPSLWELGKRRSSSLTRHLVLRFSLLMRTQSILIFCHGILKVSYVPTHFNFTSDAEVFSRSSRTMSYLIRHVLTSLPLPGNLRTLYWQKAGTGVGHTEPRTECFPDSGEQLYWNNIMKAEHSADLTPNYSVSKLREGWG